ncbi:glycine betaine/L-proline ABC transporter ATP-binding protein [Desulfolithobacter dissulfuricans]|uniref:Glycine betaine/L-proline ABC transporter ATP-binding protein n=1 Tax=Desulfolithobacter dissulfuricans TaxID=2795293 RepID=A0A915XHJ2_9BACT|nr:glycine betaine/L-proline ABC transporter ATP-binding protein ProV [Desulfolithobacter dissulfuricans]BCO08719.1 glycine betaine/L-proline ABC transporter ATP-binding protein [Desulfolithobacter dissulfuricans]
MGKIIVENLYKIFGEHPGKGLELLQQGQDKQSILDKTGLTVGVQDANFVVNSGEIFVVMGLSGSGKSTLVRMLNRLIEPTTGKVLVDGRDVVKMKHEDLVKFRLEKMSMVFQSFALMPHLTVLENVAFGLNLAKFDKVRQRERAMEALDQVGLAGWEESFPDQLSGGMQQRVGLARALAVDPDILLMDEAFSALDPLIRTEMQDELLKLQRRQQRTIVFISHDLDEALRIGDRIAIMEGGRIVQVGTPEEILRNPANDYVRAFFRGVDPTGVISVGEIVRDTQLTIIKSRVGSLRAAHELLSSQDRAHGYVLDSDRRFLGLVTAEKLKELLESGAADSPVDQGFITGIATARLDDSMQDILPEVASCTWPIPVVDEQGIYRGVVSKNRFLRTLHRAEQAEGAHC